jgi:hypothetical protein
MFEAVGDDLTRRTMRQANIHDLELPLPLPGIASTRAAGLPAGREGSLIA